MSFGSVHHRRENIEGGVYIGRPSLFGNPFVIGVDGDRAEVIERFREYAVDRCYKDQEPKAVSDSVGKLCRRWSASEGVSNKLEGHADPSCSRTGLAERTGG